MKNKGSVANLNRVAGVVSALVANDYVEAFGEQIDNLAFSFIAPLGADDRDNHRQKFGDQRSEIRIANSKLQISDSRLQKRFKITELDTKQARLRWESI